MKLDVNVLRYLGKDDFRTLTAVEMGQKNHEIVPAQLIESIAGLKHGGAFKCLKTLLRHKLVHHEGKKYDGYRLTSLGYDFLAIRALTARGSIAGVGRQIGVGKESDVFEVVDDEGRTMALKLHRLGRTSFRAVKSKRDYVKRGNHFSWLYLSRLAALKEFAFMKALGENGLPVPEAIECNRHAVLMSLVPGYPMVQIREFANAEKVYKECVDILVTLAKLGLVHCDFNEFNLLVDEEENLTLIDFPQMVSTSHANAEELFDRDMGGVIKFFERKFSSPDEAERVINSNFPSLQSAIGDGSTTIDQQLRASGFKSEHQKLLDEYNIQCDDDADDDDDDDDDDDESTDDEDSDSESSDCSETTSCSSHEQDVEEEETGQDVVDAFAELDTRDSDELRQRMEHMVAKKVSDQRRMAMNRQVVAKASRNAMKSRNKGKRKGQSSGNKPISADGGW